MATANQLEKKNKKQETVQADCLQSGTGYMGRGSSHNVPVGESQQPFLEQSPSSQISWSSDAPCRLHQSHLLHLPAWKERNYAFSLYK